jgi:phosphoribosyl 1,2-cyclic phosphodiesterase/CheY-like chemotaxis protein
MTKRVLVIDDDADMCALIRHTLELEGYEVEELPSAGELRAFIQRFQPDLILSDVMMPGVDGLSMCRSLQADPQTRALPVVLASSKSFTGDKRAALAAGAAAYLVKPFKPAELARVVRETLSTQASVRIWGCRGTIAAPEHALGRYGGNTTCIELVLARNQRLIFDAGTGIRGLGNRIVGESPLRTALLLTHYHWDHTQGLPCFKPLFVPGNEINIYGPAESRESLVETIEGQMGGEYFPISTEAFQAAVKFHAVQEQNLEVFGVSLSTLYVLHPGRTLAYRVNIGDRSVVFAPDNELLPETTAPELTAQARRFAEFAAGATLLIHDAQYSREVYQTRRGWGHSSAECVARVAAHAQVKRVLLFHHDPDSSDEAVEAIHGEFQAALDACGAEIASEPATEGEVYEL